MLTLAIRECHNIRCIILDIRLDVIVYDTVPLCERFNVLLYVLALNIFVKDLIYRLPKLA